MNKKNHLILAVVLIAIISILGLKSYNNNVQNLNAPALVNKALDENKPMWLLFRSQT